MRSASAPPPVVTVLLDRHMAAGYGAATLDAVGHARDHLSAKVGVRVLATRQIGDDAVEVAGDGVLIGPGSPYDDPDGVLRVIRVARERGIPLVGT